MSRQIENTLGAIAQQANETARPLVNNIFGVSAEFLGELKTWLEQNPPAIPVTQIVGFNQFTVKSATNINTAETTASVSYVDLATTGPSLTELPDGQYLVLFGCASSNTTDTSLMSISINGASVTSDTDPGSCESSGGLNTSVMSFFTTTLSAGSNSLVAKYRVTAGTGTFFYRRLLAIKFSN